MKRWFAPFVVGMVLLYAALALGAAGCFFLQDVSSSHAHHTPSHAGHSTFCAWACQASSTESSAVAAPLLAGFVFVAIQLVNRVIPKTLLIAAVSRSRAPPR